MWSAVVLLPGRDRVPRFSATPTGTSLSSPGMDEELRQTALEVLEDVAHWSLRPSGWERVGGGLAEMERALRAADVKRLRRAVADVEMAGPHRISGVEEAALLPLPQVYRERVDELIHGLHTPQEEQPSSGDANADGPRPHA